MSTRFHILVVEDEALQRLLIVEILSMMNYRLTTAENGKIAWELLNNPDNIFDIILLDLLMPEMNGNELLDLIQSTPKLRDIPVIMLAAHNEMDQIYPCLNKGAIDFLMKPIRPGAVKGLINQVNMYKKKAKDEERE